MKVNGHLIVKGNTQGINFTDGSNLHPKAHTFNVSGNDFYLSADVDGNPTLNLKASADTLQLYAEVPSVGNYFVETEAPYQYTIEAVSVQLQSGTATVGFYIISDGLNNNGSSIVGLDPLAVTSTKQKLAPTSTTTIQPGQQIKLSVIATSSAKQLRVSVMGNPI